MKPVVTQILSFKTRAKRISSILGPFVLGTALVMVAILLLVLPADEMSAQGPDEGYVIVQFDENDLVGRHIDFTNPISGLMALELTGLEVITYDFGWGIGVCSIDGVGRINKIYFGNKVFILIPYFFVQPLKILHILIRYMNRPTIVVSRHVDFSLDHC